METHSSPFEDQYLWNEVINHTAVFSLNNVMIIEHQIGQLKIFGKFSFQVFRIFLLNDWTQREGLFFDVELMLCSFEF